MKLSATKTYISCGVMTLFVSVSQCCHVYQKRGMKITSGCDEKLWQAQDAHKRERAEFQNKISKGSIGIPRDLECRLADNRVEHAAEDPRPDSWTVSVPQSKPYCSA